MADIGTAQRLDGWAGPAVALSPVYDQALNFARVLHAQQSRKSSGAPYLSHLLEVSGLVLEYGGDEAQAIAALLHDAIEDQAEAFGGATLLGDIIGNKFGPTVLRLVQLCSDCQGAPKPAWVWRKQQHLVRLAQATAYDCLVPACDKLHNLRCLNSEVRRGAAPFRLLKAGPQEQLRHFAAVTALFEDKRLAPAADLRNELEQLRGQLAERHFTPSPAQQYAAYAMP